MPKVEEQDSVGRGFDQPEVRGRLETRSQKGLKVAAYWSRTEVGTGWKKNIPSPMWCTELGILVLVPDRCECGLQISGKIEESIADVCDPPSKTLKHGFDSPRSGVLVDCGVELGRTGTFASCMW